MAAVLPTDVDAAYAALGRGETELVERAARLALARRPGDTGWQGALALALVAQRRAADALPLFDALVAAEPGVAAHWTNLGNCLCELEREADALVPLQRAFQMGERNSAVFYGLARAELAHGRLAQALTCIDRALELEPSDAEFLVQKSQILGALDLDDDAMAIIANLQSADLSTPLRLAGAELQMKLGAFGQAQVTLESILRDEPSCVGALVGLANCHERHNRLDEALEARLRIAGELSEHERSAVLQLDGRLADRRGDPALARRLYEEVDRRPQRDGAASIHLAFELGKVCASLGDVPSAVAHFERAHRRRREMVSALPSFFSGDHGVLAGTGRPVPAFSPLSDPTGDGRMDPVMVVGFPRSGTTLLEQLLDAHPALASFDEKPFMQSLSRRIGEATGLGYPEGLPRVDASMRAELRRHYFQHVDRVRPDLAGRRPVDKNPLSLALLPAASVVLPGAKVVLALRHPCDVVLSCWMQNFKSPAFALSFETLASTARLYDRVFSLFESFAPRLGIPVHPIRYEDLTSHVRIEAERLFGFLDLEWHDELSTFTERARKKGMISTPSYSQVVEPVNRRAVGRWQAWRPWFEGEVLETLTPWIERFGYDVG